MLRLRAVNRCLSREMIEDFLFLEALDGLSDKLMVRIGVEIIVRRNSRFLDLIGGSARRSSWNTCITNWRLKLLHLLTLVLRVLGLMWLLRRDCQCLLLCALPHFPDDLHEKAHIFVVGVFSDEKIVINCIKEVKLKVYQICPWNADSNWEISVVKEHMTSGAHMCYLFVVFDSKDEWTGE